MSRLDNKQKAPEAKSKKMDFLSRVEASVNEVSIKPSDNTPKRSANNYSAALYARELDSFRAHQQQLRDARDGIVLVAQRDGAGKTAKKAARAGKAIDFEAHRIEKLRRDWHWSVSTTTQHYRQARKLSTLEVATMMGLRESEYISLVETENEVFDTWCILLCNLAVKLRRSVKKLLSPTGRYMDLAKPVGHRIRQIRQEGYIDTHQQVVMQQSCDLSISEKVKKLQQQLRDDDEVQILFMAPDHIANELQISVGDYGKIEDGDSLLEVYGPRLLLLSEAIQESMFSFVYPDGTLILSSELRTAPQSVVEPTVNNQRRTSMLPPAATQQRRSSTIAATAVPS